MAQTVKHIATGDVVMLLPRTVTACLRKDLAVGSGPPLGEEHALQELKMVVDFAHPTVRSMTDEVIYGAQAITWGDIAAYAGMRRVTTKPHNAGRLARKRARRLGITKSRVMRHVFQFGSQRVIADPEEFVSIDDVPEEVHEYLREFNDKRNDR